MGAFFEEFAKLTALESIPTLSQTGVDQIIGMMVGRELTQRFPPKINRPKEVILEVNGLTALNQPSIKDVSFQLRKGEILGIAGISGSGQKELLEAIAGLQPTESGSIRFTDSDGNVKDLAKMNSVEIQELGVSLAFVPEDRIGMGLVGDMDMTDNMMLRSW